MDSTTLGGYGGFGGYNFTSGGNDLVSYYMFQNLLETNERLFGSTNNSYRFNTKTQKLKVFKTERDRYTCDNNNNCYVIGVKMEASVESMIGESWVHKYATALVKIAQGNALGKLNGITVLNGITINSSDILAQGIAEKETLEIWLRQRNESDESLPVIFC